VRGAGRDGDPHQAAPPPPAEEGECGERQQGGDGTGGGAGEGEPLVRGSCYTSSNIGTLASSGAVKKAGLLQHF
jgi:hypothetical protein